MKMRILIMLAGWTALVSEALGQSILFDFENATLHAPLPISITVSGLTAQFSATGQGFSIQQADTMGFTPTGFSGYCLYPSSVYLSDLLVTVLTSAAMLANGAFRFAFTNSPGATFTVLGSPNLAMPLTNWTVLGGAIEISPGQFQFTDPPATNSFHLFYMARLP